MPDLFHNPYHFVPLGAGPPPETIPLSEFQNPVPDRKHLHLTHDRFVPKTYSGRIVCRVTVETPLLCGNLQEERGADRPKLIHPFELKDGVPSLPSTALRGMLSSLAEAASHSALRVLKGNVLSFRRDVRDPLKLSALGVIERDPVSKELCLRPLSLPTLDLDRNQEVYRLPPSFQDVFPTPCFKVYLGTEPEAYHGETFRDKRGNPLKNFTTTEDGVSGPFYGMRLATGGCVWMDNSSTSVSVEGNWQRFSSTVVGHGRDRRRVPNNDYLIGRRFESSEIVPWTQGLEQEGYTRGIYRALGLWTAERRENRPKTKYHELFIPFSTDMEKWPTLPIHATALERFNQLADQRTAENKALPFEPLGTRPNRDGASLRLRPGDVVYFRPESIGGCVQVAELSLSSVWRGRAECADPKGGQLIGADTRTFFSAISPELLPLSPGRQLLTLAEQLFGVVELRDKKEEKALKDKPAFALASRLRVSHGLLQVFPKDGAYQPHTELLTPDQKAALTDRDPLPDIPLKNLASPKPPSPALYFKPKAPNTSGYVPKRALNLANHVPHGRKFYLRRRDLEQVSGNELFVHPDRLRDPNDRHGIFRQHQSVQNFVRPGCVFYFHLDFDNLTDLELQLIAYVLSPNPAFRHQLGHGKPLGLGQIHLEPVGVLEVNRLQRYGKDALTADRYHEAWVAGNPTDWPKPLSSHIPASPGHLVPKLEVLKRGFESWASTNGLTGVLRALELLGNPSAVEHAVHYPQAATDNQNARIYPNTAAFERELFRWFVENDRLRAGNQYLKTLLNAPALPTLDRQPPPPPPAGQGGHRRFDGGPPSGGGRRDDRRAQSQSTTQPTQAQNPKGPQKGDRLEFKVAAHEADKRIRFETTIEGQTWVGYLEISKHDLARWLPRYPVGWVGPLTVLGIPASRKLSLKPPTG